MSFVDRGSAEHLLKLTFCGVLLTLDTVLHHSLRVQKGEVLRKICIYTYSENTSNGVILCMYGLA